MKYMIIKGVYDCKGDISSEKVASNLDEYEADYMLDVFKTENNQSNIMYWIEKNKKKNIGQ